MQTYGQKSPFPIWNVDMLLNIVGCLGKKCGSDKIIIDSLTSSRQKRKIICGRIQTLIEAYMNTIISALREQDDYYMNIARSGDGKQTRLNVIFESCPVVSRVKDYSKALAECLYDWAKTGSVAADSDEQE